MRRNTRSLIVALTLGLLAALLAARWQPWTVVPRIGYLSPSADTDAHVQAFTRAFRYGLRECGWVEGKNLVIEWRFAEGRRERLPGLVAELVKLKVAVIVVPNASTAASVRRVTSTVPVVVAAGGDLIAAGLVASLAKPGGTVTGLQILQSDLAAKRLEMLKEVVPQFSRLGLLFPGRPGAGQIAANVLHETEEAARAAGVHLQVFGMPERPDEFGSAFAALTQAQVDAVIIVAAPFMLRHRSTIADLAVAHRLPTMFEHREYVEAGGLISYGAHIPDLYRRTAIYVDKILKGATPAELPVEQALKLELVVNLKTAHALSLTVPPVFLFRADEVLR